MKGHYTHAHKTVFRRYVPSNATVKSMASQTEETMYIVDRGASLHMIGFSSPTRTDKQTSKKQEVDASLSVNLEQDSPSALLL